jgi:hypothetical protein
MSLLCFWRPAIPQFERPPLNRFVGFFDPG